MYLHQYGITAPVQLTQLEVELCAFRHNPPPEVGGLGRAGHFWNIVDLLWPEKLDKKANPTAFIRSPWGEKLALETAQRSTLAVLGGLNSGKTDFYAVWALVSWFADPWGTMVLLVSTTIDDSKRRMWGSVKKYFQGSAFAFPGKLVDSMRLIRTDDGTGKTDDKCGIQLIAGVKSKEKEAVGKLIGIKQGKLLFICDEMPELSPALAEAYFSNLAPSNPNAQMVGIGNFNSIYDALGSLCTPKGGWGSVSPEDEEWECERGAHCIRFDGLKSPNLLLGEDKYPFLYSSKSLAKHKEAYGENSAAFWRMCRSFPCPEGDEHVLYSEADFIKGETHALPTWLEPPVVVMAADPAFTTDGDRFAVVTGLFGKNSNGLPTLAFTGYQYVHENMALTKSGEPRDIQTARQLGEIARERKCAPENCGVDCSGPGGLAFGSILSAVWSSRYVAVKFGEGPSGRLVSEDDPKRCDEAYANRVTELWAIGKQFVRAGQLKGLPQDIARELKSRQYETVKGVHLKMRVESKRDMKTRVGFSPDCFVAGTMVLTPHGEKPIETLKLGEPVVTPFGESKVIALHEQTANELSGVELSNGKHLLGKSNHGVFVWGQGWVKLDSLSLTNEVESVTRLALWQLLNALFTKAELTEFKAMVGTIKTRTGAKQRRDFYTGLSGLSTLGLFLKGCASIIKMATGGIIASLISHSWSLRNIAASTCANDSSAQRIGPKIVAYWTGPLRLQRRGTDPVMVWSGISNTPKTAFSSVDGCRFVVLSAGAQSSRGATKDTAPSCADGKHGWCALKAISGIVACAVRVLWQISTSKPLTVLRRVERSRLPKFARVYNLTLEHHNAYYANGVLVENCADAAMILIEVCRERFGFTPGSMNGMPQVQRKGDWIERANRAHEIYNNTYSDPAYEAA